MQQVFRIQLVDEGKEAAILLRGAGVHQFSLAVVVKIKMHIRAEGREEHLHLVIAHIPQGRFARLFIDGFEHGIEFIHRFGHRKSVLIQHILAEM